MGTRPSGGVGLGSLSDELVGGSESQREKVRPIKEWSQMTSDHKSHANVTPKGYGSMDGVHGRVVRKVDALIESQVHTTSPLSKSFLDLLPQHANNISPSVQTALCENSRDAGVLYSYDSLTTPGAAVDLGGLVEKAEKRFQSEQTDRIVKGEYEVLDTNGETTLLAGGKGKGKKSPKQRANIVAKSERMEEDEGFELI